MAGVPDGDGDHLTEGRRPVGLCLVVALLVGHGKALAHEARRFYLIDEGNRIILGRDTALSFAVGQQLIQGDPVRAGALAWCNEQGGTHIGVVQGFVQKRAICS